MLLLFFICAVSCFTRYGIHFWTGRKISKREFAIDIKKNFENDILTIFENKCDCLFNEKIHNLQKEDRVIVEFRQNFITIYVNDVEFTRQENTNKCFFCIQDNFK